MSEQFIAGRYRILKKLGAGAFGHTYLAEDIHLPYNPKCVVKQLKPESTDEFTVATAKRLFPREAAILNKLGKHDRIPRLLAHLEEDGEFYLVQEYIEGNDLDNEIGLGIKLEESKVIQILDEMLDILTFVGQQKVVHRDIKPSNIMRREKDGKLVLIDFGAVKEIATQVSNHQASTIIGTPGYISAEQTMGKPHYSSDVYALGMMAIFALTGIEPHQLLRDFNTGKIQWRNFTNVSPQLADIIDKMTDSNIDRRYTDAVAAHQALKQFLNPSPPDSPQDRVNSTVENDNPAIDLPSSPQPKTFPIKKILVASALLLTLGGGTYSYYLRHQQNKAPVILTYENIKYGIEIDYPQNWILEQIEDPFGTVAKLYPQSSQDKTNPTSVTIESQNIDPTISLEEYSTNTISQIIKNLPAAKIIDSRPIELNKKAAHRVVYTGKKKGNNLTQKYLQIWSKDADKVEILTYVAPEDEYQDFSETVEQTIIPSLFEKDTIE